ncbi:MAG: elongation factor Ts, partial [Chloroflexota bacterium]
MECRTALLESQGDWGRAREILKKGGLDRAEAKTGRQARQGIVGAYIHPGSKLGTLIEVNCETDFVARTEEFKTLVHDLALQVAATDHRYISAEEANPQTA